MSRVKPPAGPGALDGDARALYDRIALERHGRVLPHNLLLLRDPALARIVLELGNHVGIGNPLPFADKELMAVAAYVALRCPYAADLHARIAAEGGVDAQLVQAARRGGDDAVLSDGQRALIDYARELATDRHATDATYARVLGAYGEEALFQATAYIGYMALTATVLDAGGIDAGALAAAWPPAGEPLGR